MDRRDSGLDKRREERFPVHSRGKNAVSLAKLIVVDRPELEVECQIADVSKSGMRLVGAENLPAGALIVVELDTLLVLAEVRYSYPRGDRFVAGLQKRNTVVKLTLPDGATPAEKILALTGNKEPAQSAARVLPPAASPVASPALSPAPSVDKVESAPVPPLPAAPSLVPAPAPALDDAGHGADSETPAFVAAPLERTDFSPVESEPAEMPLRISLPADGPPVAAPPVDIRSLIAANAPPAAASAATNPRRWLVTAGFVCTFGALAGFAYVSGLFPQAWQHSAAPQQVPTVTDSVPAPAPAAPVASAPTPAPTPATPVASAPTSAQAPAAPVASIPAQAQSRVRAEILSHAMNWVSACADGKGTYTKVLQAGDSLKFDFSAKAVLRMGNSGATEVTLDGKSVGPIGAPGSPRVIALDAAGFSYLTAMPADGSGDCAAANAH